MCDESKGAYVASLRGKTRSTSKSPNVSFSAAVVRVPKQAAIVQAVQRGLYILGLESIVRRRQAASDLEMCRSECW